MMRTINNVVSTILFAALSTLANAALVTSNTISNPVVVDFSTQATVSASAGPIQIGAPVGQDITVVPIVPGNSLSTNYNGWGLGINGEWGNPMTYISSQSQAGMRFSFNDGPVAAVGGFMNHYPTSSDLIITALDSSLNVLETYNITTQADIVTPGGVNAGAFRGIVRASADIAYFEVTGESPALDDLTFSDNGTAPPPSTESTPVPTMPIYALVLTTLGLLLVATRRLRTAFKSN